MKKLSTKKLVQKDLWPKDLITAQGLTEAMIDLMRRCPYTGERVDAVKKIYRLRDLFRKLKL